MKKVLITALVLLTASTAFAAGQLKAPKVLACQNFNEFHDKNGVAIGMCGATKPGGKVRILGSYAIVKVVNPATDKAELVMVGFL